MIGIRKIDEISRIKITTYPNERNNFRTPLIQDVSIPGIFFMGEKWSLEHECKQCGSLIMTGESFLNFNRIGHLSIGVINNKSVLDAMGSTLNQKLKHEVDSNNFEIYNYSLVGKYKDITNTAHYKCDCCSTQYLIAYCNLWGEGERNPTPDEVYIEKILQVSFDHELFMKILEEARK